MQAKYNTRIFLTILLATFALILLPIAILNWAVDPFDLFQHKLFGLTRANKAQVERHQRLVKAADIMKLKPEGLVLGSSRVLEGIDIACLEGHCHLNCYNCGLPGANMEEILAYLQHALHNQPHLKLVVIGVDLFAFNGNRLPRRDFSAARLNRSSLPQNEQFQLLLTYDALRATFKTLFPKSKQLILDEKGFLLAQGMDAHLNRSHRPYEEKELRVLKRLFSNGDIYGNFNLSPQAIGQFKQLAALCRTHDITLKAFISPMRAHYWYALYEQGLWPAFEELRRQLSEAADLVDLSGINPITDHPLSEDKRDRYFDMSHYRPEVGEQVLAILFASEHPYLLTKDNYFEASPEPIIKWAEQHPADRDFVITTLEAAKRDLKK